jgi:NDP-hexose-3-ketoreductase
VTVRFGVLGTSAIARRSTAPAIRSDPRCALVAVASRTRERAAAFARDLHCAPVTGYLDLLDRDDVDAVYVPLPTGLHHTWIEAALHAGKHVLAEKSLTVDARRTAALVELARSRSLALMENFMFLRHGQHRRVDELVSGGALGELRGFAAEFAIPPRPADDIRYSADLGGGALLDTGAYTVRCAQRFLGDDLIVAGAVAGIDAASGVDVRGSALLVSPAGVPAQLSYGLDHAYRCSYTISGTRGRLQLDRAFTTPPDMCPRVRLDRGGDTEVLTLEPDDHFAGSIAHFARLVTGEDDRDAEYAACLNQSRLLDEIHRGAHQLVCPPIHPF